MEEETKKKIDDLQKQIEDLKSMIFEQSTTLQQHTHSGNDGSSFLYNDNLNLKPGQSIQTGNFSIEEVTGNVLGQELVRGHLVLGDDKTIADGFDNAQLTLEHQPTTNGSSNQTFFYGFRGKAYIGYDGGVTSGGTLFTTNSASFEVNKLAGHTILVNDPANAGQFDGFEILSNTENTITISGTWTFTSSGCTFFIFVPIYSGSAQFPWRRIYTGNGSGGGIRFGLGDTNGGQNSLLYMDGNDLKLRKPNGTVTTVTVT